MNNNFKSLAVLFFSIPLISCGNSGIDTVDAYEFKIENTHLFNDYDKFIKEVGLPSTFVAFKDTIKINTPSDLDAAIANNIGKTDMLHLCYPNFIMEYFPDKLVVPLSFDFRDSNKEIQFNDVKFNGTFSVNQFKRMFPISGRTPLGTSMSLFAMITGENTSNLQHFIVARKSKDVEFGDSGPSIEFTFENEKLIYIFFANF